MDQVCQVQGSRNGGAWLLLYLDNFHLSIFGACHADFVGTKENSYKIKGFAYFYT